ncbi:hypothetical protein COW36_05365 [bacterium (Candidatus Blackallbacteria) CG17_big_fil_post_rev_8_21_14_2_50_48_46]|uniref:Uncharacterized protein n=1 Tax=bacterium (Candidatus Blackallbacteria) CG17_big_fil_post_rev_8_21_14_2_50_48_46 TaxID=2014261 RepID=A0A2M7G850_9BACT|nr:MAG: hypothetical protein COW64_20960 [bacterium (Candidatus Blackallbacteria) CG18_big_fil_WC_8_21_14_2_50_49_26]PIW18198.1 MAG: hypothetical protein COW36_05365 [bacterium (Candidatus Blackallbacteria) CG17_big_fil_post_rev_8_21_14_2_50_48_46]PIW50629.1 MAG: hypothetical protein COW20_01630 [bacterium (Candidatus Blackallbacteria) CG13_big_fil_rev_8_21_14_2_50_49_14]
MKRVQKELLESLGAELVSVYIRPGESVEKDKYLVLLYDASVSHLRSLRPLLEKYKNLGSFQFMGYQEMLSMLTVSSLDVVNWYFGGISLLEDDILAHYRIHLGNLCDQLEIALHKESSQFRHEILMADTKRKETQALNRSWMRFEASILPGLYCVSGVGSDLHQLESAFSLAEEGFLCALAKDLQEKSFLADEICLQKWEESLLHLTYQMEVFAGYLAEDELALRNLNLTLFPAEPGLQNLRSVS